MMNAQAIKVLARLSGDGIVYAGKEPIALRKA